MKWRKVEAGWYCLGEDSPAKAAVSLETNGKWSVYIDEDMPPGDSQHKTMREAMAEAERRVRANEQTDHRENS